MTPFHDQNGGLWVEEVDLADLAQTVGTPAYIYSAGRLRDNLARLQKALPEALICFAVKANGNLAVLKTLGQAGAGADIVSGGELQRALQAGIDPGRIVYSGVGKTTGEITAALTAGIHQINAESLEELAQINAVAKGLGRPADIVLRINPDVAADTHDKIATGRRGDKFGIDHEQLPDATALLGTLPYLNLTGLAVHVGSQLFDLDTFRRAYGILARCLTGLRGAGFALTRLDLGGGMGVPYDGEMPFDVEGYARMTRETVGQLGCTLTLEPGRYLVADAGVLLSRVVLVKTGTTNRFVVLDAGMNDLIRPALYGARHRIRPVRTPAPDATRQTVDVVGPVCESGDVFAQAQELPELAPGDLVVLETAGAYGATMAGTYNARDLCPEVLVDGSRRAIVRPRISAQEQIGWDRFPDWM